MALVALINSVVRLVRGGGSGGGKGGVESALGGVGSAIGVVGLWVRGVLGVENCRFDFYERVVSRVQGDTRRSRVCVAGACVRVAEAVANELTNDLHPMLYRNRWPGVRDNDWLTLQPVLRLASMFLTTPTSWEWYEHVATGVIKQRRNGTTYIDSPSEQLTQEQKQNVVRDILLKMTDTTTFFIGNNVDERYVSHFIEKDADAFARIRRFDMYNPMHPSIHINPERLERLRALEGSPLGQRGYLFMVFYVASILLHEIAHVFTYSAHRFGLQWTKTSNFEPSFQ